MALGHNNSPPAPDVSTSLFQSSKMLLLLNQFSWLGASSSVVKILFKNSTGTKLVFELPW